MANLTNDNGSKTPVELAKSIVNDAVVDKTATISGTAFQKLETVVRYLNRDKIQARGENWFKHNHNMLLTDALETLIVAREKAITEYLKKKEQQELDEAFRMLTARGVPVQEAYNKIYKA